MTLSASTKCIMDGPPEVGFSSIIMRPHTPITARLRFVSVGTQTLPDDMLQRMSRVSATSLERVAISDGTQNDGTTGVPEAPEKKHDDALFEADARHNMELRLWVLWRDGHRS